MQETFYIDKIGLIRDDELKTVRKVAYVGWFSLVNANSDLAPRIARSGLFSSVTLVPIAAAILSFVRSCHPG